MNTSVIERFEIGSLTKRSVTLYLPVSRQPLAAIFHRYPDDRYPSSVIIIGGRPCNVAGDTLQPPRDCRGNYRRPVNEWNRNQRGTVLVS